MIKATIGGKTIVIENKEGAITVNNKSLSLDKIITGPGSYHLLINNISYSVNVIEQSRAEKKYLLEVNGKVFEVSLKDRLDDLLHELGMDNLSSQKIHDLKAPMPGLVVAVFVKEGQQIEKGDTIVILEAMKMENALKATANVIVKKIAVEKGMAVEKNEVLVYFN